MAALEDTTVTYEDLAAIERSFEDADLEITKTQARLLTPLYKSRHLTTSQIPNFWPLVLEQAPPDIDQYIQPSDSSLLLSSLSSLSVSPFEFTPSTSSSSKEVEEGDPRSISITMEFKENEYFNNTRLEKKFWFRRDRTGFSGLVSEPIRIEWKSKEKDLTGGLLSLVCDCWEEEQKQAQSQKATAASTSSSKANGKSKAPAKAAKPQLTPNQKILKKKIENTGMGGMSFFAWFGFIGRRVSAEENAEALRYWNAGVVPEQKEEEEGDDNDEDDDISYDLEIFPDGDDLAIAISEDLWPGAIKYFTQAQEQDALSDADFESDDDDDVEGGGVSDLNDQGSEEDEEEQEQELPVKKKRKA